MSKARGYGLVIIKDAVIIFEFKRSAGSYTQATGFENGLIVEYYDAHLPYSIMNFSYNEQSKELFLIDSSGSIAQLRITLVPRLNDVLGKLDEI